MIIQQKNSSIQYTCILFVLLGGCMPMMMGAHTYSVKNSPQETAITPIMPYQAGDEHLPCSELNREIGKLDERVSRLIDQNEYEEKLKENNANPIMGALSFGVGKIISVAKRKEEESYGTETSNVIQTYQERIEHLQKISKSRGC